MSAEETIARIGAAKVSAIVRAGRAGRALPALAAAVRGGFRVVEATLTTPDALAAIEALASREELVVGAGTVLDAGQAREAVAAGARYLVSPIVDERVIEVALELGVVVMPGAHTPTEMMLAYRAGAQLVKLFPAPAGGPAWLRAALGPLPFLRVVPTNGVDEGNARTWLEAGAFALGFAAVLFPPEDLEAAAFDRIAARATRLVAAVLPRA